MLWSHSFEDYVDDIFRVSKKLFNSKSVKWQNIQEKLPKLTTNLREQIRFEIDFAESE